VKEKFFKGEKHKARGSGIGLAVCDEIITRSGGTLRDAGIGFCGFGFAHMVTSVRMKLRS